MDGMPITWNHFVSNILAILFCWLLMLNFGLFTSCGTAEDGNRSHNRNLQLFHDPITDSFTLDQLHLEQKNSTSFPRSISEIAYSDGTIYFSAEDRHLYGINIESGERNWEYTLDAPLISYPIVDTQRLYIPTLDGRMLAIGLQDKTIQWETPMDGTLSTFIRPVVDQEGIYFATSTGYIYGLNKESGGLIWEAIRLPEGVYNSLTYDSKTNYLIVGSDDGGLYAINKATGEIVWKVEHSKSIRRSQAVLFTDYVASIDTAGNILLVVIKTGEITRTKTFQPPHGHPLAYKQWMLYPQSDDVVAIQLETMSLASAFPYKKEEFLDYCMLGNLLIMQTDLGNQLLVYNLENPTQQRSLSLPSKPFRQAIPLNDRRLLFVLEGSELMILSIR
jgi:hypothetical protein